MSYNGYKNYETWLFMLHFGDYLFETLHEQQEQNTLNFQTIYETIEDFIDEMYDSVEHLDNTFLNDVINASLRAIDVKEVANVLAQELKED